VDVSWCLFKFEIDIDNKEKANAYFDIKTQERILKLETRINKLSSNTIVSYSIIFSVILLSGYWQILQEPISFVKAFMLISIMTMSLELISSKRTQYLL